MFLIIPSNELVSIWHAQGLLQDKGSRSIEDTGMGYLNELINRSILQIQDLTIDGQVKSFRLHDLLRDVCLSKAEEEMSLKILKGEKETESSSESSYKPRYQVVHHKSSETLSSNQNKYLRSLFLLNLGSELSSRMDIPTPYWKSFQLLKTLYLDGFGFTKLPNSFRCLVGLKYLRITNRDDIYLKLPSWLADFKKLEFLYVNYVEFSRVALKMESLRGFGAHRVWGRALKVSKWKSIESLKAIRLADWVEMSSGLMPDSHLRELGMSIEIWEGTNDDLVSRGRESLQKMTNLVKLHLKFEDYREFDELYTLPKLISNLESLTSLKLKMAFFGVKYPVVVGLFPPNLSHLTLSTRQDVSMEELGKLPKLEYLTIKHLKYTSCVSFRRMKILHDGFPCLKALSLKRMGDLTFIDIEEGGMSCLKQLRIRGCPYLKTEYLPKRIIISFA